MKEININIEGYNVNGICVGCLNYNRKMYYDNDIQTCYKIIANIDVPDGLTIQVCWQCLSEVKKIIRFQTQILAAYEVLINYSKQHTFLNSPKDFTQHSVTRLTVTPVHIEDISRVKEIDIKIDHVIKEENKPEIDIYDSVFDDDGIKIEGSEDLPLPDFPLEQAASSDEDIQLSQIKEKKEKKEKKKKKKDKSSKNPSLSRKLKNLPEDIVEVYTMSEEEMWEVRAADAESEGFRRLRHACARCLLAFNTRQLKDSHDSGRHRPKGGRRHQCDVCCAYFLSAESARAHRSLHRAAFRCRACGARSAVKRLMAAHSCTRAPRPLACAHCHKLFSSKSKLAYHRSTSCRAERPQCDCCGKIFANKMTLKYHLKLLPLKKEEKPKEEKLYIPCKGCNKVFQSKKSYRAHVVVSTPYVTGRKPIGDYSVIHEGHSYPCPICGKLFQWKRNLSRHTRAHKDRDAGATHQCRECNKTFASRDCYNNHMRLSKRHASEATYVHECNYCGKKFPTKWCMIDHIDWDHLKRVKYQCSVCFKAFKTAKIMVAHVNNIHAGRRREPDGDHLCDVCGKSYKTVKRLKAHVWAMHTQRSTAKSYKCTLCAASFTWQTSIYKHMKMMHSNKRTKTARPAPAPALKQESYDLQYYAQTALTQPTEHSLNLYKV